MWRFKAKGTWESGDAKHKARELRKVKKQGKRSLGKWRVSSQWQKRELEVKLPPFSSFLKFFVVFLLRRR
jgi:hypothetical protein